MTNDELRELDAWIAEHVMGWMKCTMRNLDHAGRYAVQGGEIYIHDRGNYVKLFHPTTSPADAMRVLEKCLKSNRPHGGIVIYDSQVSAVACFTICAQAIGNLRAQAETLELAICLFARKVFEK